MTRSDRLNRFFREDRRTVILPLDHGLAVPVPELSRPAELMAQVSDWVDGYVLNLGVLAAVKHSLASRPVCLRTDVYKPAHQDYPDEVPYRVFGADDAARHGADAMMNMLYPHHPKEGESFHAAASLVSESHGSEIPVILEALPFGLGRPLDYTVANIAYAVRAAAELGADVVKTAFPTHGTSDDMKRIVEGALVPVIVLGGAPDQDDAALLTMVRQSIDGGAAGVAIGRRVWSHPQPEKIAKALHAVVHDDASVSNALKLL